MSEKKRIGRPPKGGKRLMVRADFWDRVKPEIVADFLAVPRVTALLEHLATLPGKNTRELAINDAVIETPVVF
jgi:hypothetical protein